MRDRIHKLVHRLVGGSVVLISSLQQLRMIDLAPIFGNVSGAKIAMFLGTAIALLEFLPLLVSFFEDKEPE